jgi:hypothetical protein
MFGNLSRAVGGAVDNVTGKKQQPAQNERDFAAGAASVCKGEVRMFSGCMDNQTSADVSNVASFGLPKVQGPSSAGGACTNSLLATIKQKGNGLTYGELLTDMQKMLKAKKYTQVPQLSSSRQVNLKEEKFSVMNPSPNGRTKCLLIGINYFGQGGELSGCVNDVKMIKAFLEQQGYAATPDRMQILTDDVNFANAAPTASNIFNAMQWLLADMQPGDSLFFHFSGHGGQLEDDDGDEDDGFDETMVPVDYQTAGQIRDDVIFKMLVAPLIEGVQLVALFDCCHSGTILDLPYMFAADDSGCASIASGNATTAQNGGFNMSSALALVGQVAKGILASFDEVTRSVGSKGRSAKAGGKLPGPLGKLF